MEEQSKLEHECNGHSAQWGCLLCLGDKWNGSGQHQKRLGSALWTNNCMVHPLYGLSKDHKPIPPDKKHLGHPLRLVCGATECINISLSNLLTEVLTAVGDLADTTGFNCVSTEEVMASLTSLCTEADAFQKLVVMSMDVDNMFPRLDTVMVARVAAEEILRSGLKVEVDAVKLGLYLSVLYQDRRGELEALGLAEIVQRRKCPKAKKIMITTEKLLERGQDGQDESKFLPPERAATDEEKKKIFALALEAGVTTCMNQHSYSLGTEIRKQAGGAP